MVLQAYAKLTDEPVINNLFQFDACQHTGSLSHKQEIPAVMAGLMDIAVLRRLGRVVHYLLTQVAEKR